MVITTNLMFICIAKLLTKAVNMRMNPNLLVQAAAARVKISNDIKNEQLSRLEL